MQSPRKILFMLALALAAAALNPLPAGAQTASHRQALPTAAWGTPTSAAGQPLGIGQWVYVAPIPTAGPGQLPTTGYVYGPTFFPEGERGVVGLATDAGGPIAGIQVEGATAKLATIRYNWSPGTFYYLVAYHLGNGRWGGWVYDNTAATWTPIGAVQAAAPGLLSNSSVTVVSGAQGGPAAPFGQEGPAVGQPCSAFPRVDAYFYPPVLYWETTAVVSTVASLNPFPGDCPTAATMEYDWAHFRLGSLAP
jgi:hypothetical protein